ncbi:hypothetical protein LZC95_28930 [Pendulispora brunnea]|uniref:Transmembrane protein n=1 Tax=Pendulispora brunnea TaxID=2905690 RepID=A0ABZ2JZG2_9BACT
MAWMSAGTPQIVFLSSDHLELDGNDERTEVYPSFSSITVIGAPRPAMRPPPPGAALPVYSPPSWVQPPEPTAPVAAQVLPSTWTWVTAFAAMGISCGLLVMGVVRSNEHGPRATASANAASVQRLAPPLQARPLPSIGVVMPEGVTPTPAGRRLDEPHKPLASSPRPKKRERGIDNGRTAYANLSDEQLQRMLAP